MKWGSSVSAWCNALVTNSKDNLWGDGSTSRDTGVFLMRRVKVNTTEEFWTYRREVVSAAWLPSVFAWQEHFIQLVAQSIHKLKVGSFKVSGGQKEPKVWQLFEPGLTVLLKQVQNHGPHGPVSQQQAQPVAGEVQVTLGELVEADRVVVADSDCGEGQFFSPLCVDPCVCGEGKPVE